MTNLDSILKLRDIPLPTKVHLVKTGFSSSHVGMWETKRNLSTKELMLLNCGVGENSWESLGLQGDPTSPSYRKSVLNIHWKDWCRSWNSNTLATWCEELTHWKGPWCWEQLKAGREGDDRGWNGEMDHRLNGHECEYTPGVGDGQGGLAFFSPWVRKESDMTEQLNWTKSNHQLVAFDLRANAFSSSPLSILAVGLSYKSSMPSFWSVWLVASVVSNSLQPRAPWPARLIWT